MWVGALMCLKLSMCLSAFLDQGPNANVLEVPLLSQVTGSVQDHFIWTPGPAGLLKDTHD